jgi:resolvase-like protein
MSSTKRAALYVRVSTDAQTLENQIRELRQVARRRGWDVVEVYSDAGISGAKGRNGRPGLDSMLKDASRRKFDIVMAWAIDRLGRSLSDLLDTIQHLEACGVDLYLDQQAIDTTTPMGKLVFQLTGLCGVRADDDPPTDQCRSQARRRPRREARQTEGRQCDRTECAKAACEGHRYLKGRQVARAWDWHGAAHLK